MWNFVYFLPGEGSGIALAVGFLLALTAVQMFLENIVVKIILSVLGTAVLITIIVVQIRKRRERKQETDAEDLQVEGQAAAGKSKFAAARVLLIVTAVLIVTAGAVSAFCSYENVTVSPLDYTEIRFTGNNGAGEAKALLSGVDLMKEYFGSRLKFNEESEQAGELYLTEHGYDSPIDLLLDYIRNDGEYGFGLEPSSGLSNGDTVTLRWSFFGKSEEVALLMSHLNADLECPEMEYTVSGLEAASAVMSLNAVPETDLAAIQSEAERIFYDDMISQWDSTERTVESLDCLGYCLMTRKDLSASKLYVVLEFHPLQYGWAEDGSPADKSFAYYWYVCFNDCHMLEDGTFFIDYTDYSLPPFQLFQGEMSGICETTAADGWKISLAYAGYPDLDSMYESQIAVYLDEYTLDSNVFGPVA